MSEIVRKSARILASSSTQVSDAQQVLDTQKTKTATKKVPVAAKKTKEPVAKKGVDAVTDDEAKPAAKKANAKKAADTVTDDEAKPAAKKANAKKGTDAVTEDEAKPAAKKANAKKGTDAVTEDEAKPAAKKAKVTASKAKATSEKKETKEAEKKPATKDDATPEPVTKSALKIKEGELVPKTIGDMEVLNSNAETVPLSSLYANESVVMFFYPKANTPGCTKQACGFRDNYHVFTEHGFGVVGMSGDTASAQASWKDKQKLPYALVSDRSKDRHVLKALGVNKAPASVSRSHVIIARGGKVLKVAYGVSPPDSFNGAKEFVEKHK